MYESKLYFFDEYTDHSTDHIQKVLSAVEDIITQETFLLLNSKDITVIVLAVLLHDIGMHTSFATFKALVVDNAYDDVQEESIDSKKWHVLWEEYLDEAKKFSSKQRSAIFGDSEFEFSRPNLVRKGSITDDEKKLIGEFIRRHHARLAHEIAFKGIVGENGQTIDFAPNLPKLLRQLTAIVARSHGINIRQTYPFLELVGDKAWKLPDQVNVIFLMVLIRIADYFQFGSDRVNPNALKLKTFGSPISQFEHDKHLSIDFIQQDTTDKETLFVKANPKTSVMYVKLKDLFKDIQYELDLSWAVLGEVYGYVDRESQPKIKYRRINSNLESLNFLNSIQYIPAKITFETDVDLPKLLVAPLYGNDPSYGVREMTQNAVDACREREFEEIKNTISYSPTITIGIIKENDIYFFIIKDNGKGMTLSELKNYFLKAGSSFRKSLDWQLKYTNEEGKTQIQRNGRFGVGVLAAFLLGEKLYIETRNMHSTEGYSFEAEIDTEQIEINKRTDLSVGTFIKIHIKANVIKALNNPQQKIWHEWYVLNSPYIEYINESDLKFKPKVFNLPNDNDRLPKTFHSIKPSGLNKVIWTYDKDYRQNKLTCNGIVIPTKPTISYPKLLNSYETDTIIRVTPTISIFDYDGTLPLSLNRNKIDGILSFSDELVNDIYKDIIACLLCFKFESYLTENQIHITTQSFYHPAFYDPGNAVNRSDISNILHSKDGFIYNYGYFTNKLTSKTLINIFSKSDELDLAFEESISSQYLFNIQVEQKVRLSYNDNIVEPLQRWDVGGRITMRKQDYDAVFDPTKNRARKGLKDNHVIDLEKDGWVTYSEKYIKPINKKLLKVFTEKQDIVAIKEIPLIKTKSEKIFDSLLERYIGKNVIIPYDIESRQDMFKKSFTELEVYCEKYL
ncbi:HD domain-containing protein [Spirosoma jeollabukense]